MLEVILHFPPLRARCKELAMLYNPDRDQVT
jgi:hypothetical protein